METVIMLTPDTIQAFCDDLHHRERSPGTIAQYRRALLHLSEFLSEDQMIDKSALLEWKTAISTQRAARTVNAMIAAVNAFLTFIDAPALKLRSLRFQRETFSEMELSRSDFLALVAQAQRNHDNQTVALLHAMSGTGLRVSEIRFLTVEAVRSKMLVVRLKGKTRRIPLGDKLCYELDTFARSVGVRTGPIFLGFHGRPLDRRRIWEKLKRLCIGAGVEPQKVHPHALRHLFARLFYDLTRDISKLADLLGHSSLETTRIYVMTSCDEHRAILNGLTEWLTTRQRPAPPGRQRFRLSKFPFPGSR